MHASRRKFLLGGKKYGYFYLSESAPYHQYYYAGNIQIIDPESKLPEFIYQRTGGKGNA